jgi:outer membrane biosynthesis protein TonB
MKVRKSFILIILLTFSIIFAGPSYAEESNKSNNNGDITVDVEKLDEMVKQFQDMDITKDPEGNQPNKSDPSSSEKSENMIEMSTQINTQAVGKGPDGASEEGEAGEKTEENPEENKEEIDKTTENPDGKKEEPATEKIEDKQAEKKEEPKKEEKQAEKTPIAKEPEDPGNNNSSGETTGIMATLESLRSNSDFNNIFSNTKESKGNVQVKSQKRADNRAVPTGNTSYADGILSAKSLIIIIAILAAIFSAISIAIKDRRYKRSKSE